MKNKKIIKVPSNYYYRVHETRYRNIFNSGAVFRQKQMNPNVAGAWEKFLSTVNLPSPAVGLEFGTGTGINAITMSGQGFNMVGVDISPTAVKKAKILAEQKNSSVNFIAGDMFTPLFKSSSFDFLVNIWTLHAVGEQFLRDQHLLECYRMLKKGGWFFLHNESSERDVLDAREEIVIEYTDDWNIPEYTNKFSLPDQSEVEVKFPGHMPEGLFGRRSLHEHKKELQKAGFKIHKCYEEIMQLHSSIPSNRIMVVFAYKE